MVDIWVGPYIRPKIMKTTQAYINTKGKRRHKLKRTLKMRILIMPDGAREGE